MSKSMRDQLSEAMETMGETGEESRQEILMDDIEEDETLPPGTEGEDETEAEGDSAAPPAREKKEAAEEKGKPTSAEGKPDADAASDFTEKSQSLKAPAGWTPKEREMWSKVPKELQARISAREREMTTGMADSKSSKSVSDYVTKMGSHYAPLLQGSGFKHPLDAAAAALGTMNTLHSGSQREKATELARIISQFGVDIEELDNALVGGSGGQGQQNVNPQEAMFKRMLDERMGPVNELMSNAQQLQQRQAQNVSQNAMQSVIKFGESAEFLGDVREDMADIIELADRRGVQMTLQQAYDRACAGHPEISSVIEQRKNDRSLMSGKSAVAAKRSAASSISGRQSGSGGGTAGMTLRQQLAAAVDDAST